MEPLRLPRKVSTSTSAARAASKGLLCGGGKGTGKKWQPELVQLLLLQWLVQLLLLLLR